jgi:hypothetical protein
MFGGGGSSPSGFIFLGLPLPLLVGSTSYSLLIMLSNLRYFKHLTII